MNLILSFTIACILFHSQHSLIISTGRSTKVLSKAISTKSTTALFMSSQTPAVGTLVYPPNTFVDCVKQSVASVKAALDNNIKLVEVEFPPLPLEYLEDSSSSARDIADANTRWAIEFARDFTDLGQISIIYPDQPELDDALVYVKKEFGSVENLNRNISLATIRADSIKNAKSLDQIFMSVFGATVGGVVEGIPNTKMYIAVVSSTQELPDLEKLHNIDPSIPIVFFNLRLDVLRGDLGLPLFPNRELQYRFLSNILPAYMLKSKSFATSLRKPPFIINYSGVLFRSYPQPYQSILNIGNGKNKLAKSNSERPTNMEFRENLTNQLKVPGVSADELNVKGNLVWWEKDLDKMLSKNWII
eukprot:gene5490-7601_t